MRTPMRTPYTYRKDALADLEPFDPTRSDYTEQELAKYADQLLRSVDTENILFQEHIEPRWRREVGVGTGTPDAAVTHALSKDGQTMYNRQHPEGRKVNTERQRKVGRASYYRG